MSDISQAELEAYRRDPDHHRHTPGCPEDPRWQHYRDLPHYHYLKVANRLRFCGQMDMAWTLMLVKQDLLDKPTAAKALKVLKDSQTEQGWGGEKWIKKKLPDHDERVASAVNYGRTLQEPMARMMMREALLDVFDELFMAMESLLNIATDNVDTLMAGHSHWAHAQPTTYAAYLLAIHDQLARGMEQLELAYRHTNQNSGGCGACSGTGWPVDRETVTELLGFDKTIDVSYDCEGSMDEMMTILFACSNLALTLSRTALDHNVWVTEEWNLFHVEMQWRGVSSFMPQKANAGNVFEHMRMAANEVLGNMSTGVFSFKNEPVQDVLPVYRADRYPLRAMGELIRGLGLLGSMLPHVKPNRERMERLVREGFSGSPDLAIYLIRQKGYAGRCAHRICATMIRIARERGIKPWECTGELLDEAARVTGDDEPKLTDAEVQSPLNLEHFFDTHCNTGDPCPSESMRLIEARRKELAEARSRQDERKKKVDAARENLLAQVDALIEEAG